MSSAAQEHRWEERSLDYNSHNHWGRLSLTGVGDFSWKNSAENCEWHQVPGRAPRRGGGQRASSASQKLPENLFSPGYLLLGLLAVLLAVETFSELPHARALVKFFGSSGPLTAEDQGGILGQDELALSTLPPSAAAPERAPAC